MRFLLKSANRKLRKALFHFEIENRYKKKLVMPLPKYIQLEPTIRCNYDCVGCTRLTVLKDRVLDISVDQVKKILKLIPTLKKIKLMGLGEPFLHPEYENILKLFKEKKLRLWSISNGSLLFRERHRNLVHNYYEDITISLDTTDSKEFSEIRPGGPGLERILNTIRILIKERNQGYSDVSIGIAFAVGHMNYKKIHKTYELALDLGVDYMHITGIENWTVKGQQSFESYAKFAETSRKIQKEIDNSVFKLRRKLLVKGVLTGYKGSSLRLNNCHWPFNGLNITVDGIATPCCIRMDPKFHKLENLMNLDNFEDLWNGEKYINLRKAHINKDLKNIMCGSCPN